MRCTRLAAPCAQEDIPGKVGWVPEYYNVVLTCGYVSDGSALFAIKDTDGEFSWAALEQPQSPVSVAPECAFLPRGHGSILSFADEELPLLS